MNDKLSYLSKYVNPSKKRKKKEKEKTKTKTKKRHMNSSLLYDDDIDNHMGNTIEDELDQDNPIVILPDGVSTMNLDQIMKQNQNKKKESKSNFIPVNDVKNEDACNEKRQRRRRYDSDDESNHSQLRSERKDERFDSESSASATNRRRSIRSRRSRRRSYSSSSNSSSSSHRNTRNVKRRSNRKRYDSSSSENDETKESFQTSTIYRDNKTGKRLNMNARYQNVISKHEQQQLDIIALNKGHVQKKQEEETRKRNKEIQMKPFARTKNDRDNDTKNVIRKDDPMMKLVQKVSCTRSLFFFFQFFFYFLTKIITLC